MGSGSTVPRRTTQICRKRPATASEKSGSSEKYSPRPRRVDGCCQRQVGKAHTQLTATGHGTVISRIMAPRQQNQIGRSRGKNVTGQKPVASQSDSGQRNLGHRNKRKALWSSFLCPPFLCHSSSDRTSRPSTARKEARIQRRTSLAVG